MIFPVICALIIASIAYFINREVLGSGKEIMERVLLPKISTKTGMFLSSECLALRFPLLQEVLAEFSLRLLLGASIGSVISGIIHLTPNETNVVILAGMVAFLTGITRAPVYFSHYCTGNDGQTFPDIPSDACRNDLFYCFHLVSRHSLYDVLKVNFLTEIRNRDEQNAGIHSKGNN